MAMQLIAEYQGQRKQILLRPGQSARVGRSAWVDLSIADDSELADEHFVIDGRDQWQLIASTEQSITSENDGLADGRLILKDGTKFTAGGTQFFVRVSRHEAPTPGSPDHASQITPANHSDGRIVQTIASKSVWPEARDWSVFGWSASVMAAIETAPGPQAAAESLFAAGELAEALQLIAATLAPRDAVLWSVQQTGHVCSEELRKWLEDPSDAQRNTIEQTVAPGGPQSFTPCDAVNWVVQAVLWTGGSLGPPNVAPVPPPSHLVAIAAATAIQLQIAASGNALAASQAVQAGCKLLDCEYPEPSVAPAG